MAHKKETKLSFTHHTLSSLSKFPNYQFIQLLRLWTIGSRALGDFRGCYRPWELWARVPAMHKCGDTTWVSCSFITHIRNSFALTFKTTGITARGHWQPSLCSLSRQVITLRYDGENKPTTLQLSHLLKDKDITAGLKPLPPRGCCVSGRSRDPGRSSATGKAAAFLVCFTD